MAELKKILVTLPDYLLQEVDEILAMENIGVSEFVCDAMKVYIKQKYRANIAEQMRVGYQQMAHINCELTEIGLNLDKKILEAYELILTGNR